MTSRHRRTSAVICTSALASALLFLLPWAMPRAHAASTFTAHSIGLFQGGGLDEDTATSATPVTVTSTVNNSNGQIEAESHADRGFLTLSGFVNGVASRGTSGTLGTSIEFPDVKIRRIDGAPSSEVLPVTFQYTTSFTAAWSGPVLAFAGFNASDFTALAQITQGPNGFSESDQYKKDYFAGDTGTPGLETVAANLQVDVPFTLKLSIFSGGLSARTGNFGQYDIAVNVGPAAIASGFEVESLASPFAITSAPVFVLPAGYTVDSPEMNLFDNQWQAVPEPGSFALLTVSVLALLLCRRARRANG